MWSLTIQFVTEPTKFESMKIHLSDVSTNVFVVVAKVNQSYFFRGFLDIVVANRILNQLVFSA